MSKYFSMTEINVPSVNPSSTFSSSLHSLFSICLFLLTFGKTAFVTKVAASLTFFPLFNLSHSVISVCRCSHSNEKTRARENKSCSSEESFGCNKQTGQRVALSSCPSHFPGPQLFPSLLMAWYFCPLYVRHLEKWPFSLSQDNHADMFVHVCSSFEYPTHLDKGIKMRQYTLRISVC